MRTRITLANELQHARRSGVVLPRELLKRSFRLIRGGQNDDGRPA